jgi:hypothetical protein
MGNTENGLSVYIISHNSCFVKHNIKPSILQIFNIETLFLTLNITQAAGNIKEIWYKLPLKKVCGVSLVSILNRSSLVGDLYGERRSL